MSIFAIGTATENSPNKRFTPKILSKKTLGRCMDLQEKITPLCKQRFMG
jgi:hypothetical protein